MRVSVYEVSPRDGLQNLPVFVDTEIKRRLIDNLYSAGIKKIEETSTAHPKLVPQMADAEKVFRKGSVLVMNKKGYDRALAMGAEKINIVFSPCEEFNMKNMKKTRSEIILMYKTFMKIPKKNVRAYISMSFGSPYSGEVRENTMRSCIRDAKMFADTIVFADTVGIATPRKMKTLIKLAKEEDVKIAIHLHHKGDEDKAMEIVKVALFGGVKEFDSSIGGLGGCPFSEDSGANISTERLVRSLHSWGFTTGVDIKKLIVAGKLATRIKENNSNILAV
jgi:hydroxymethylglutaryl-CoA lyase